MISSSALMGLASLAKQTSLGVIAAGIAMTIIACFLLTGLIRIVDHASIASARRLLGLFFVSTLIWIIPLAIGVTISSFTQLHAGANEFIFGAFLVWGFETIVINGAFVRNTLVSLALAAIHPLAVLLIPLSAGGYLYVYPALTGFVTLALMVIFLLRLENLKTKHGIPAVQVLQAFLKTWVGHEPGDLERYFSNYARNGSVVTDVLLAENKGERVVFVLPGVHPGPFFPVGSYNLSELIYRALKHEGVNPVVFHGTGGHERNTPTNDLAAAYATEISRFVSSLTAPERGMMKGPAHDKVGITNITTVAFGNAILSIISNSPFLSDDFDPTTVNEASNAASNLGLKLSMVDAHNSVDGESRPQTQITREEWEGIFTRVMVLPEKAFSIGFASSKEIELKLGPDVSDGGISVTMFATDDSKNVLVSADSNNAVSSLRGRISDELGKSGVGFIELCTSDTHNFAARNRTERGYFALGEVSGVDSILDAVKTLTSVAEGKLSPCDLRAARFESQTAMIGTESLDDFAGLTKNAISLARNYAKVFGPIILLLAAITLFY